MTEVTVDWPYAAIDEKTAQQQITIFEEVFMMWSSCEIRSRTVVPGLTMAVLMNHGSARPMSTSNTLLPIVFDTAMSP